MLSAAGFSQLHAEEAISQNHPLAPVEQRKSENLPAGSCMPIGLTARGNIVFPWECRELIEKQRGPVSEEGDLPEVCIKCGAPATAHKYKTFSWFPGWVYVYEGFAAVESPKTPSPFRSHEYVMGSPSGSPEPEPSKFTVSGAGPRRKAAEGHRTPRRSREGP